MSKHGVIIDPATSVAEIDCFNRIVKAHRPAMTYHLPAIGGMNSLYSEKDEEIACIVVFGSGANMDDHLPWVLELGSWLEGKMAAGLPVLGLCFGHQLIASISGAKISPSRPSKHLGLREVCFLDDPLASLDKGKLVVSHYQELESCPAGFLKSATSQEVEFDGLRHKTLPIFTYQGHPEATMEFISNQEVPGVGPKDLSLGHQLVDQFIYKSTTEFSS